MASPIDRQDGVLVFGNNDDLVVQQSPKKGLIQKVARFFCLGRAPSAEPRIGLGESPWAGRSVKVNPVYNSDDSGLGIKNESPIKEIGDSVIGSPSDLLVEKQLTPSSQNSQSPELFEEPSGTMVFKPIQPAPLKSKSLEEEASGSMVVNSIRSESSRQTPAFMKNHNFEDNAGKWDKYLAEDAARVLAEEPIYITRANLDPQTELYAVLPCDRDDAEMIVIDNLPEYIVCSVKELEKNSVDLTLYPISPGFVAERINRYSPK